MKTLRRCWSGQRTSSSSRSHVSAAFVLQSAGCIPVDQDAARWTIPGYHIARGLPQSTKAPCEPPLRYHPPHPRHSTSAWSLQLSTESSRVTLPFAGDEAAQTFIKLADVHVKLESKSEAASSWVEASKAYQKSGNPGARQLAQSNACTGAGPQSAMSEISLYSDACCGCFECPLLVLLHMPAVARPSLSCEHVTNPACTSWHRCQAYISTRYQS